MMNMKKIILLAALALVGVGLSAKKTVTVVETPASDSRIEYTGRILVEGDEVS